MGLGNAKPVTLFASFRFHLQDGPCAITRNGSAFRLKRLWPRGAPPAMSDLVFVVAGFVCLVSACAIVSQKNPVYSVLCMLPFFIGMAVLFVMLQAPFMAAMQMMVYGGAILVVFLFVIMLINLRPEEIKDDLTLLSYGSSAVLGGLLGGFLLSLVKEGIPAQSDLATKFSEPIGPIGAN